jgi:hypothetical protein
MPVCIFIDDLDRCRAEYVVELLAGIQTAFRHNRVFYVVAADRGWIRASFEASYDKFAKSVGSVGQPLGYLFLEKIFQLSMPLPGMGKDIREKYIKWLLKKPASQDGKDFENVVAPERKELDFAAAVASKRKELRETYGENLTPADADTFLLESDTTVNRAAAALELNISRAAEAGRKHLLESMTDILPDVRQR